jgi:hypothetical protein
MRRNGSLSMPPSQRVGRLSAQEINPQPLPQAWEKTTRRIRNES